MLTLFIYIDITLRSGNPSDEIAEEDFAKVLGIALFTSYGIKS